MEEIISAIVEEGFGKLKPSQQGKMELKLYELAFFFPTKENPEIIEVDNKESKVKFDVKAKVLIK